MAEDYVDESELRRQYAAACVEFTARVRILSEAAGGLEAEMFMSLWDRCEDARRVCTELRERISARFFGRRLTIREMEVLRLVAEGLANKEIAVALGISVKTVEFHKHAIYERLSVTSSAALVRHAIKIGLIQP